MCLERNTNLIFNLKRIIRIKKKYGLETKIRRRNKMKAARKINEEHEVMPNLLQRNFNPKEDEVLISTDTTELRFLRGQRAYLSAFMDLKSKKIIHYSLNQRATMDLVMTGLDQMLENINAKKREKIIIHSDQGYHYTSIAYRTKLSNYGVSQSMSRKGDCLDNAPIESFFGHLKDESEYRACRNGSELEEEITRYMNYYNDERPQWGLKRKTPAEAEVNMNLVF